VGASSCSSPRGLCVAGADSVSQQPCLLSISEPIEASRDNYCDAPDWNQLSLSLSTASLACEINKLEQP